MQERGVGWIKVAHLLDDVDARRRVQHFVEDPGAFQPQIHQREIDIVVSAAARLQRILPALFLLEPLSHLQELFARAAALSVAAPIHPLQLVQEGVPRSMLPATARVFMYVMPSQASAELAK